MKKINIVLLFSILMIGSLMFMPVVFAEEESTPNVESGFNLGGWLNHQLGNAQFSVVGDMRNCGNNNLPNAEINVAYREGIPTYRDYCTNALTDVFDTNWNPLGEYKNKLTFLCGDTDGCIVQYYCCPHPECSDDEDCEDWYGTGSVCTTMSSADPGITYQSSTFKYCTDPSDIQKVCYYYPGTGTTCSTRTYLGQDFCPASYNGMTLYSTQSACVNSINTCTDTCASLGFTSGTHTICGASINCGTVTSTCDDYSHSTKAICESHGCIWSGLFSGKCTGNGNNTCTDTCASLGYTSGTHTICGASINCGTGGDGILEIGEVCSIDTDCKSSYCDKNHWYSLLDKCQPTPWDEVYRLSFTREQIGEATTSELVGIACIDGKHCLSTDKDLYDAKCISLSKLRDDGTLQVGTQSFFDEAHTMLNRGAIGAGIGALTCVGGAVAAILTSPTIAGAALFGTISATACTTLIAGGAILGANSAIGTDNKNEIVKFLDAEDMDSVGLCVNEEKSNNTLDAYFKWAAFFDVDGNGTKNGIDGLIIVVGTLLIFGFIFKR